MPQPNSPQPSAPPIVAANAAWRSVEFISDLHLAADMPATFAVLRSYLATTDADAVFILGDLFEVWVGDDARFDDFERACVDLLAGASTRRPLYFMVGNRDFLAGDAFCVAAGLRRLHDPTILEAFSQRWLLSHGDELCVDDVDYQRFRTEVRSPAWQHDFLARPLAQRRDLARQLRDASELRRQSMNVGDWADVDAVAARAWLQAAGAQTLIHGHTHRPRDHDLGEGLRRLVLSDWDLDHDPQRPRAEVLRLDATGAHRRAMVASAERG
jgi:UDP-2,3-diacylglucosamine hydrolase